LANDAFGKHTPGQDAQTMFCKGKEINTSHLNIL